MSAARLICIGTHHKTGTIWMRRVWKRIADSQNIPYRAIYRGGVLNDVPQTGPVILVNWSSAFPKALLERSEARFLHLIRDPRDVLISGMRYHQIANVHREKFLAIRREDLGGQTYQEHLCRLPDDRARLLFEMGEKHADTLDEMLRWNYDHPGSVELRYEDLIADRTCGLFRNALEWMAVTGLDIDGAVRCFWEHSLFGGMAAVDARPKRLQRHIAAGHPRQWKERLPRDVARLYENRFGKALRHLSYAMDGSWVDLCPESYSGNTDRAASSAAAWHSTPKA